MPAICAPVSSPSLCCLCTAQQTFALLCLSLLCEVSGAALWTKNAMSLLLNAKQTTHTLGAHGIRNVSCVVVAASTEATGVFVAFSRSPDDEPHAVQSCEPAFLPCAQHVCEFLCVFARMLAFTCVRLCVRVRICCVDGDGDFMYRIGPPLECDTNTLLIYVRICTLCACDSARRRSFCGDFVRRAMVCSSFCARMNESSSCPMLQTKTDETSRRRHDIRQQQQQKQKCAGCRSPI